MLIDAFIFVKKNVEEINESVTNSLICGKKAFWMAE
jgi:hypothetical protein